MKLDYKNYKFWISLLGAVILIVSNVGDIIGFSVDDELLKTLVDSVCGLLVVMGIINNPTKPSDNNIIDDEDDKQDTV